MNNQPSPTVEQLLARQAALEAEIARLQAQEAKYQGLVQNANSIILEWDSSGVITFLNRYGLDFFGYSAEELIGQSMVGTIVPPAESSGRNLQYLMDDILVHPERYQHHENENITKDNERVWCVWSNTARFDAQGTFVGVLSIGSDITAQKYAENALHRQNEYLAALHETTLGLVSRLEVTDLLESIILRAGQLLGTSHGSIYLINPERDLLELVVGVGSFHSKLGTTLQKGESVPGKVWQFGQPYLINDYQTWADKSPNFDYRNLRAGMGVPLTKMGDSRSEMVGVLGLGYDYESTGQCDISSVELLDRFAQLTSIALDNARLYNEAQVARQAAESANQAKSTFLANVSHELRTPLTSVLGFTKIIQKRLQQIFPLTDMSHQRTKRSVQQVYQNLEIILAEGERLTALINDVLDLAKIEAGKIEWDMQPLDISVIVERALAATSSLFAESGLQLITDVAPNLPKVLGDRDRLIQVMINLISNGIKFTERGSLTCQAYRRESEVIVTITDTGQGIALEEQEGVFDKFKQAGNTLTDKPQGTGLGLPICKEIIRNHEGSIWLESELGQGTTVSFRLPILAPTSNAVADAWIKKLDIELLIQQFESHRESYQNRPEQLILVVDDESYIRTLLRQALEAQDYQVIEAKDGLEAMAKINQQRPDLITLDVMMPKISGFDVASMLKNDPLTANIPLVMLSIVEDHGRSYRIGADRYLKKPFDLEKLFVEIETLLNQGGLKKRVLIVDDNQSTQNILTNLLHKEGYQVNTTFSIDNVIPIAIGYQPDMVIVNAFHSAENYELIKTIRDQDGLENVMFFFFQESA